MADIAVIALDMDGTLLSSDLQVTEKTANAIQQARKKGIEVILVTGRHHMMAYPVHHQLALDTPLICANGAYVFDTKNQQITAGTPLSERQWQQLIPLMESLQLDAICHFSDGIGHQPENEHVGRVKNFVQAFPSINVRILLNMNLLRLYVTHILHCGKSSYRTPQHPRSMILS